MPLAQAVATEDQLAVGKSFSGKTHALSVSASVNDRLLRRMYTTVSNPTEIQQKCVQKNCNASVHISLKVKTGEYSQTVWVCVCGYVYVAYTRAHTHAHAHAHFSSDTSGTAIPTGKVVIPGKPK